MFAIPSLADLVTRARSSFRSYLPGSDAWIWPNNIYPTAKVLAGVAYEVFGFADYIAKQKFAGTADGENLDLHAQEFGLSRRPAAPSSGSVAVVCQGAATCNAGAVFRRTDGVEYIATTGDASPTAGTLTVDVIAATDGATTNADGGTPLEIVSGLSDVDGTVSAPLATVGPLGIVGGVDIEADGEQWSTDLATLRGRILFRKRNPPHGGAPADYVQWLTTQAGVSRVFVERRWNGRGTVRVFPLLDDVYAGGIPLLADIVRLQNYVETVKPSGAEVTIAPAAPVSVDVTVTNLVPNTTAVQEAVLIELRDTFRRLSVVAGNDTPNGALPFLAVPASFSRSWIWQAIANATGEQRHILTSPAADIALTAGQIATLGNVTFS